MLWTVILDSLVIALLGVGIFYAWRLERMLRGLDRNREAMEKFVLDFSSAVTRAEKGIRELQDTAQDTGVEVDRSLNRAKGLRDELNYLIDAADKIASRLTENSSAAIARKPAAPVVEEPAPKAPVIEPILEMSAAPASVPPWAKRAGQEHIVINRVEKKPFRKAEAVAKAVNAPIYAEGGGGLRSEAERELQQALEKMR